ncbi:MAG: hypothetical protein H6719_01905 [Sandaracinaceae bacterium]|nr:hypothetical protein [Sandaracinaceae bacterium]
MRRLALFTCLGLLVPTAASAQLRVIHDTLSADTPTSITCGFCAGEQFGVIFRELPSGRRGLEPTDFPLTIDAIEVALGAAHVEASMCVPQRSGGTVTAAMAIYAGDTVPTGSILALPETGEWSATETLVWASDAVPLGLSVENDMGLYELMFNRLEVADDMGMPITVASGTYLRVVITLPVGEAGTSNLCAAPLEPAGGYPMRDNDGLIANERSFIYAGGAGWFWNEGVPGGGIGGDWGIRLSVFPSGVVPGTDAGVMGTDAGTPDVDGGGTPDVDGGATTDVDAGETVTPPSDGCSCRAAAPSPGSPAALAVALLGLAWIARRRRNRRRVPDDERA